MGAVGQVPLGVGDQDRELVDSDVIGPVGVEPAGRDSLREADRSEVVVADDVGSGRRRRRAHDRCPAACLRSCPSTQDPLSTTGLPLLRSNRDLTRKVVSSATICSKTGPT
ncbi:hypothetical protein GCM10023199_42830 [Actinomycetospora chibensis]